MPGPGVFAVLHSISFEVPEGGSWSARNDAALGALAARRLARPHLDAVLDELERLGDHREELWDYVLHAAARRFASSGMTRDQFATLHADATSSHLAAFDAAIAKDDGEAVLIEALARAAHATTVEPVLEGMPSPGAEAAALVIQTALDGGVLRGVELLAAAKGLSAGLSIESMAVDAAHAN
jgi:hypothetical protein